jgi:hypothetical protein
VLSSRVEKTVDVWGQQRRHVDVETGRITRQQFMISRADPLADVLLQLALVRAVLDTCWPVHLPVRLLHTPHPPHPRVEPGTAAGVPNFDHATLGQKIKTYVDGPRWTPHYVAFSGVTVLVIVVEVAKTR